MPANFRLVLITGSTLVDANGRPGGLELDRVISRHRSLGNAIRAMATYDHTHRGSAKRTRVQVNLVTGWEVVGP